MIYKGINVSKAKELMGYSFLVVFANDSTIDEHELEMLERLALEDNKIDAQEREVLHNIFSRINKDTVTENVWKEILNFKQKYGIE